MFNVKQTGILTQPPLKGLSSYYVTHFGLLVISTKKASKNWLFGLPQNLVNIPFIPYFNIVYLYV